MEVLSVKNLCKDYPAFHLKNVTFSMEQGCIMGFIGRNGAGKSTTLKAILNMVHPTGGEVALFGREFASNESYIKQHIGVVLGGIDFYPKKKIKTITAVTRHFYPEWDESKYQHYCQLFEIDGEKRVDQLSSGMRVKYMIALALSHGATLLILDEPTSGLDPVSRDDLMELFRKIVQSGERSILFSTHITSDLEKCATHITFIKEGEILNTGTMQAFKEAYRYLEEPGKELTLEDIIVSVERKGYDEESII